MLVGVLTARLLGPSGRGELALVMNAMGLTLPLTSLGLKQAAAYFIGKEGYQDELLMAIHRVVAPLATLATVAGAVGLMMWSGDVKLTAVLIVGLSVYCLARIRFDYACGLYLARTRIYEFNLLTVIRAVLELCAVWVFLVYSRSVVAYVFAAAISYVLAFFLAARRQRSSAAPAIAPMEFAVLRTVVSKGVLYALPMFVMGLNYSADVLMLGRFREASSVGIYSVAVMLVSGLWFLPNIVNLVVFAHGVAVPRERATDYSRVVFQRSLKTVTYGLPLALLGAFLAGPVVGFVFGEEFRPAARAFVWLLPGAYLMLFFKLLNGDLAARGRPDVATRVFGLAFIVNLALNLWWIPLHGYIGAAAASTVSYAIGAAMFLRNYLRITGIRPRT